MEGYIIATNHVVEKYSVSCESIYDRMCSSKKQYIKTFHFFNVHIYFYRKDWKEIHEMVNGNHPRVIVL